MYSVLAANILSAIVRHQSGHGYEFTAAETFD
jgi:hypothetical protein